MKYLLITFCTIFALVIYAQTADIPKNYEVIKQIYGDLNKDRIDEKVVVYNIRTSDSLEALDGIDREVIIFQKLKNNWIIWERSLKAVGNSIDGGMMGDPFQDIEVINGILVITEAGGSSWKWSTTDKYRFQNNNFELIGFSTFYGKPCEYWLDFDYNVSTGKVSIKKEYEECPEENPVVYKKENEMFIKKLKTKVTFKNRKDVEVKLISPKYKHEIHL